jgi:hypothetical protein
LAIPNYIKPINKGKKEEKRDFFFCVFFGGMILLLIYTFSVYIVIIEYRKFGRDGGRRDN